MPTELRRLKAVCLFCRTERVTDPEPVDAGPEAAPGRFRQLLPWLARWGWAVRPDPSSPTEGAVCCPACAARKGAGLKPYDGRAKCPKCGHNRVACRYDPGRDFGSLVSVEHLVRACLRCGFLWPEATKDAPKGEPAAVEAIPEPNEPAEVTADVS